ncbi:MAG: TIM barrel protein [Pseudomonadota bacterium]
MPRYAANLTMLFTEVPSLDRPGLAAQAGFDGVEILFPYDHPVKDWQAALGTMPLALINTPPGDWASGDRGHAAVPGMEETFRAHFLRAADIATRLGAGKVHVMAGVAKGPQATQVFVENLSWAAQTAPELTLTIEPLNAEDWPGYFLNDFDQAARILQDLDAPARVGLQFDVWHAARIHGDAQAVWDKHRDLVNHVQIAGFPNRAEPGGGGFDLTAMFRDLDAQGYAGWVAAEYRPTRATVHGLGWLNALKARDRMIGLAP